MMTILERIVEAFPEEFIYIADGLDEAVIGIDTNSMRLIYSVSKILEILEKDMPPEDALEYFSFNIEGAFITDGQGNLVTPIYCTDTL